MKNNKKHSIILINYELLHIVRRRNVDGANKDILKLIGELEDMLENAANKLFSSKVSIDKEEFLEVLKDIKIALPNQFKQADYVYKEKEKILEDARLEAESMLEKTREYIKEKASDSEITKIAQENAQKIEEESNLRADQIKDGAKNYSITMLSQVSKVILELNEKLEKNIKELEEYDL